MVNHPLQILNLSIKDTSLPQYARFQDIFWNFKRYISWPDYLKKAFGEKNLVRCKSYRPYRVRRPCDVTKVKKLSVSLIYKHEKGRLGLREALEQAFSDFQIICRLPLIWRCYNHISNFKLDWLLFSTAYIRFPIKLADHIFLWRRQRGFRYRSFIWVEIVGAVAV